MNHCSGRNNAPIVSFDLLLGSWPGMSGFIGVGIADASDYVFMPPFLGKGF